MKACFSLHQRAPFPRLVGLAALIALLLFGACGKRRAPKGVGGIQEGIASWYGEPFHGRQTASGEVYDMHGISAAHKTLPLGTLVEVTNLDNGHSLEVRINDRGPFVGRRILDLSRGAAERLDMIQAGLAPVRIRVLRLGPTGPEARSPQTGTFTLQAGAFAARDGAEARAEQLRAMGYEVDLVKRSGLHRVQLGRYDRRQDAEAMARELAAQGVEALVIGLR